MTKPLQACLLGLTALLGAAPSAPAVTTASSFATASRLATGHWVKVRISEPGIQAITYDTLRRWGFDSPEQVRVYGYSTVEHNPRITASSAPDDLPPVAQVTCGDRLVFYGEGTTRALLTKAPGKDMPYPITLTRATHSDDTYYFLSDVACPDTPKPEQGTCTVAADAPELATHRALQLWQPEQYARLDAGAILYSYPVEQSRPYTFRFQMPGSLGDAWLGYRVVGYGDKAWTVPLRLPEGTSADPSRTATVAELAKPNDYFLYTASGWGSYPFTVDPGAPSTLAASVEMLGQPGAEVSFLSARNAYLTYERRTDLGQLPQLSMQLPGLTAPTRLDLGEVPDDAMLWNVTVPTLPVSYAVERAQGRATACVPAGAAAQYVLFSPSRLLPEPQWAGEVENQSLHSTPDPAPEMIIVSNQVCLPAARELARLHEQSHQKMNVQVVTQQQVFNEFSSGARSAEAVRKFLQMNWMRGGKKLKYAIMFGAGTWDNRAHLGHDTGDYLVTYQNDSIGILRNEAICTATDMYFGMLDPARETAAGKCKIDLADGRQGISIAVGRIPARTLAEAQGYVEKVRTYFTSPEQAGDFNTVMCVGDLSDQNQHVSKGVDADADTIAKYGSGGTTFLKVYQELYGGADQTRRELDAAFSRPVSMMLYSGHSNQHSMGKYVFIDQATEPGLTYGSMPLVFAAACSPLGIDQEKRGLLGQMLVRHDNGPIAIIGAHRTVFMTPNQTLEHEFAKQYAQASSADRIGDLYLRVVNKMFQPITSTWTLRRNTLCYSMVGDPAVPIYAPLYSAVATEIDGKPIGDDAPVLTPGQATELSGEIRSDKGVRMPLDGHITVDIYNAPYMTRLNELHPTDKGVKTYVTLDQERLATVTASVKSGRWTARFTAPEPPTPRMKTDTAGVAVEPTYRITLSAVNTARSSHLTERPQWATGWLTARYLSTPPEAKPIDDNEPPTIVEFAIEDAGADQMTCADVVAVAVVRDTGSGLSLSPIKDGPRLLSDGHPMAEVASRFRGCGDGTYTLRLPLTGLGDGRHTLSLSVTDNARNSAQAELTFVVDTSVATATLTADTEVARRDITLDLAHTLSAAHGTPQATLIIDDALGRTVRRLQDVAYPYTLDVAGLADGTYTAQALLRTPTRAFHSQKLEFTVLKARN